MVLDKAWYTFRVTTPGEWERANADPTWMICAVCARMLEKHNWTDDDGVAQVDWVHPTDIRMAGSDHEVWPVPASQLAIETKCDFCFEPDPQWVQPARDFGLPSMPGQPTQGSHSDWACCDACADLLNRGLWSALTRRATKAYMARHASDEERLRSPEAEVLVEMMLKVMYRDLRKNVTGTVYHK